MTTPGVIRKVDSLGRIVIPVSMRGRLQLESGDLVELSMENDQLVLRKFALRCIFCGGTQDLLSFRNKTVCEDCARHLRA